MIPIIPISLSYSHLFFFQAGQIQMKMMIFFFQGSTVNMNLMGWLYSKVAASLGSAGHTTLGVTLMIG